MVQSGMKEQVAEWRKAYGASSAVNKEFEALYQALRPNEEVIEVIFGNANQRGHIEMLAATSIRLLWLISDLLSIEHISYPYADIQGVGVRKGPIKGDVWITFNNKDFSIHLGGLTKSKIDNFALTVERKLEDVPPTTGVESLDTEDRLIALADLRARGLLTEDEFTKLKSNLLRDL